MPARKKSPRRAPARKPAAAEAYHAELAEVRFRTDVDFLPHDSMSRTSTGTATTHTINGLTGGKIGCTRIHTDGVLVFIETEKFRLRATPLSNVVAMEPAEKPKPRPKAAVEEAAVLHDNPDSSVIGRATAELYNGPDLEPPPAA